MEGLRMNIVDAQREMRLRFAGGFYGQVVSGALWLASAGFATWGSPKTAIMLLVIGGFFIFPLTELLIRTNRTGARLNSMNSLPQLGMQVAFVLPLSMPLLLPVAMHRLDWFFPGMMILLGAHYMPFVFLYGMRMFAVLSAVLIGGGMIIALRLSYSFGLGAWYTGVTLLVFAFIGRVLVQRECLKSAAQ
jgi:hypothetical protein